MKRTDNRPIVPKCKHCHIVAVSVTLPTNEEFWNEWTNIKTLQNFGFGYNVGNER